MSDGSSSLYFRDFDDFRKKGELKVTFRGIALKYLNELEYVKGRIYANVWFSNLIFIINPHSGVVEKFIDLSALCGKEFRGDIDAVLNGIAYDKEADLFYVTGKNWGHFYKIRIVN
jgi:glutamine cyclotransferase